MCYDTHDTSDIKASQEEDSNKNRKKLGIRMTGGMGNISARPNLTLATRPHATNLSSVIHVMLYCLPLSIALRIRGRQGIA